MKICTSCNQNKIFAKKLCRRCYDAQPDQLERRRIYTNSKEYKRPRLVIQAKAQLKNLLADLEGYKRTADFKKYVKAYKKTEVYRKWMGKRNRLYERSKLKSA